MLKAGYIQKVWIGQKLKKQINGLDQYMILQLY